MTSTFQARRDRPKVARVSGRRDPARRVIVVGCKTILDGVKYGFVHGNILSAGFVDGANSVAPSKVCPAGLGMQNGGADGATLFKITVRVYELVKAIKHWLGRLSGRPT